MTNNFATLIKHYYSDNTLLPNNIQASDTTFSNEIISHELIEFYRKKITDESFKKEYPCISSSLRTLHFISMKFIDINFSYSVFDNCTIKNCTFNDINFAKMQCYNCCFENCLFGNSFFDQSLFRNTIIKDCRFLNAAFHIAMFEESQFIETVFKVNQQQKSMGIGSGVLSNSTISNSIKSIEFKEDTFFGTIINQLRELNLYFD